MRVAAGRAAAAAARSKKFRRGSFISLSSNSYRREGSIRLGPRKLDHLAPFLGFFSNEFAEVGGRVRKRRGTQVRKPRLQLGIGKNRVDFLVELVDYFGGRVFRRDHAIP